MLLLLLLGCSPGSLTLPDSGPVLDSEPDSAPDSLLDSLLDSRLDSVMDTEVEDVPAAPDHLPVILLDLDGRDIGSSSKTPGTLTWVQPNDGTLDNLDQLPVRLETPIGIEIHGSSSTGYPKLGYRLELQDEAGEDAQYKLLGLPKGSDWVLRAPYADKTLVRDALAYQLGRDIAGDEGDWQPRTQHFELFIDDEYLGVYLLVERVRRDNDRVDIQQVARNATEGDVTGGYIVHIDQHRNEGWDSKEGTPIDYHYPRYDDISAAQDAWIQSYFNSFEKLLLSKTWDDPTTGYSTWIEVQSWVDHFIINELTHNIDAYRLSAYLYKDSDLVDGRLHAGPLWDFDRAWGNVNYCYCWQTDGFVIDSLTQCGYGYQYPFWWERLLTDEAFTEALRCRWEALREDELSDMALEQTLFALVDALDEAEPRDHERWQVLGQHVDPNYYVGDTYDDEVLWLRAWVLDRAEWLDGNMPGECP